MRETRYLWIGNLGESVREDKIADYFRRYGKIDKVRFLSKRSGDSGLTAYVAFVDIRSAQKAKTAVNIIGDRELLTDYFDPVARAGNEESQRHEPPQQSQSRAYRRYEGVKNSGPDERSGRESMPLSERSYQASETGSNHSNEKVRTKSDFAETKSRPQSSSKKKPESKMSKKKMEDVKAKPKKGQQKWSKERGRSPTVKQRKSYTSSGSSPSRSGSKRLGSSTEGRSSSSVSMGGGSVSEGHRSSSASSSSSTGSSNSSKTHRSNSESSESSYEVEEKPESRKLVPMCIRKLPIRPTITSLRDGIFHEFKKYGKVKSVLVRGDGADRHALVLFRTAAEANKAVAHARTKLLFGAAIEASIYEGEVTGQELEECGGIIDEFHPRASRTLFVGNLDKTVGYSDIQNIFVRFGEIVAIEIKKQHNIPQYAFLQYTDIMSVVRAITKMDGEKLGRNTLKLGFGKTVISSCLWVDGVTDSFTENYLSRCFQRYGPVKHVVIDRSRGQALVFYAQYDFAQSAMQKLRARKLNGSRLKMDYASNELVEIFLKHMKNSGQSFQGLDSIRQLLQPPSSPVSTSIPSSSTGYARSSISQENRSTYYEERHQSNYSDEQYADGNYRRNWRGRSRERHPYPVEQTSYNRPKRNYEDSYSRPDYHRDSTWEHDNYADGRGRLSQHDQDYRQRDYDFRRDHRGYVRKQSSRSSIPYDDSLRYRGSRDRYRDERDSENVRDRDQIGDRYYSRSVHLSPSHPRYHPRRSRSVSPHPRDQDRYPIERGTSDSTYRRRGSCSPDGRFDTVHRMNSIDSKSSSHSESRYPARSGDVDMREYMDDDKLSVSSRQSDERIVEFTERARKLRVRKRVAADVTAHESSMSPHSHYKYRGASDNIQSKNSPENYSETHWQSDSPVYSENSRSVGGTPTRDENEDLIGEVIIKKSGSRVPDKTSSLEKIKPHQKGASGDDKHCDKDYRKDFTGSSATIKSDVSIKSRSKSRSTSLIKRVHSPVNVRKESVAYEKDFDYRKPPATATSKLDAQVSGQERSKGSRSDERARGTDTGSDYDQQASPSERRVSSSGPSLLKREYSPKLKDKDDYSNKRSRNSDLPSSKEKYKEHKRKTETTTERDESSRQSQKRRHSQDTDAPVAKVKRERKSISEHHKHKSSHDHSQKHEAPMSIASQMFLQDEEDSGNESPVVTQEPVPVEIEKQDSPDDESVPAEQPESRSSVDISAATLSAAKSLLPKAFSKAQKQIPVAGENDEEKKKKEGNLTELEKEKERLQKLLSKLDSEKQLNPKDAEEVADVVLQELTQKARSKLNIITEPKPDHTVKQEDKLQKEKTEIVEDIIDETVLEIDKEDDIDQLGSDDVTFEEEVVVDTIEEVTEDEIIETEVEEITVKDDDEMENIDTKVDEVQEIVVAPQPPEIVIKPLDTKKIDNSLSYRKQMEAQRKEMEKIEKKRDNQRKKIFKKQEKEKKKQIEHVSALRGPGQSVVSSVDDEIEDETSAKDVVEDIGHVEIDENAKHETIEQISEVVGQENDNENSTVAKTDDHPTDVGIVQLDHVEHEQLDSIVGNNESNDAETVLKESGNEELWPPDRGKNATPSSNDSIIQQEPKNKQDSAVINSLQTVGKVSMKNSTPTTPNSAGPNTPVSIVKDSSPKISVQSLTPSSSTASSLSQKTQAVTTSRTPVFTTPSPASSSSNSSSKSQRHKQMKMPTHQRHTHSSRMGQSRADHSSRSHGHHSSNADHRRLSSHSHRPKTHASSSNTQNHHKSDGHKKPAPQISRRSLATITVGLDASPSKPLSRNELERLRHELESVRNQLDAESVSPSSLSPCSDDENGCKSRSPAQLLSPVSPLLKSPGNIMAQNKKSDGHFSTILQNSSSTTSSSSLTDRLKLLGKVKKRTSSVLPDAKTDPPPASEHITNNQTESMSGRIYRSSIIDQDSERLSHIAQGFADNSFNNLHRSVTPLAQNVPLFSGSKFLQSATCPPVNHAFAPVPATGPVQNSVTTNAILPNEIPSVDNETCIQSLISSNTGPKNVLSLSSSNLPVTAERQSDVFGKKSNAEIVEPNRLGTPKEMYSEEVDSTNLASPSQNIAVEMNIAETESPRDIVPPNTAVYQSAESSAHLTSQSTEENVPENTNAEMIPEDEKDVVECQLQSAIEDGDMNVVSGLEIEPGTCMEITTEDVVDANAGDGSLMMVEDPNLKVEEENATSRKDDIIEHSASEVTKQDKGNEVGSSSRDESHAVIDASKKPEKSEDIHVKKKVKIESTTKPNDGEEMKSKKEKSKIEKKKSNKSEPSKIQVSSKHKLSKDGKKEKLVKKDAHKKGKIEATKTKSSDMKAKLQVDDTVTKTVSKPASNELQMSKDELRKSNFSESTHKQKHNANGSDGERHDSSKRPSQKKSIQVEEKTKKSMPPEEKTKSMPVEEKTKKPMPFDEKTKKSMEEKGRKSMTFEEKAAKSMPLEEKTRKSIQLEEKVEKKTKVKSEKRENIDVWSSSYKDKSDFDEKQALPDSRSENTQKDETTQAIKKKKKKKRLLEKKEKHSDQKQSKQLSEGKSSAESSHLDKIKKKSDGNDKSKKIVAEKLKTTEGNIEKFKFNENITDATGKLDKEHAKSSLIQSTVKASSGSSKKEKPTKKMKSHSDLKVSNSAPPSMSKKSSDGFEGRKKLKKSHTSKKEEKSSTRKSPQPLIFSDSSNDSDNEAYSQQTFKNLDHPIAEETEKMSVDNRNDEKKWSDFDDDAEGEKRHWSMSSSSSVLDSSSHAGGQSAMLTIETIKNETILPDNYRSAVYSGSSDEDFGDTSRNKPFVTDNRSSNLSKSQKKKSVNSKVKQVESKTNQIPVFSSQSDSDSSPNRLVMSLTNSESSDEVSKPKRSVFKRSAMTFSDEDSDHDAEPERRTPKPQLKVLPTKVDHKIKTAHSDKTKVSKAEVDEGIPGHDRKIQSKKVEKSSKKNEAKLAKKLAKAHKKEKRKAEISSDNDSDVLETSKSSSKGKSKHPSKLRKLDTKGERSPIMPSSKFEHKPSKSSPKVENQKEKPHFKTKKHKESSKTRNLKIDNGKTKEQEFEKGNVKMEKSDVSGFLKKKEKTSTKSVMPEDVSRESRQTPDKEFLKHSKKSLKHHKNSEISSGKLDKPKIESEGAEKSLVSKESRSKKGHKTGEKSDKQERERAEKEERERIEEERERTEREECERLEKEERERTEREERERLEKEHERIEKEEHERVEKESKPAAPPKEEATSEIESSKRDIDYVKHEVELKSQDNIKDIGYSLFGSESDDDDDDDDNFMIDEDRDENVNPDEFPATTAEAETTNVTTTAESDTSKIPDQKHKDDDNFMSSATSDESDKEQKEAVKSAISMLDQDHDVHDTKPDMHLQTSHHEGSPHEISKVVERQFDKPPPRPRSLSPLKKVVASESSRNRKSSHDLCDVKREKLSSLNQPHSAYPISQRHLTYGSKDRWERMDKMKSISHEREEEAVRSIMGILDESSDADSYFSDVTMEKAPSHQSASETALQDVETPHQKVKESDEGIQTHAVSLKEELDKGGESCQENEDADDELTKMRSAAEENELAAAVSAIEGYFGDFPNDPDNSDRFIPDNSHRLSARQTTEDMSRKKTKDSYNEDLSRTVGRKMLDADSEKSDNEKNPFGTSTSLQKAMDESVKENSRKSDLNVGASGQLVSSRSATSDLELPSKRNDHGFPNPAFVQQQSSSYVKDAPHISSINHPEAVEMPTGDRHTTGEPQMSTKPAVQARPVENVAAESDKMQRKRNSPEPPVNYDSMEESVIRTSQVTSNANDTARSFAGLPFVSTVQAPAPQRKPSVTSATSLPFVAVSTTVVAQPPASLPVCTASEQPVQPQKFVDQRPKATSNTPARDEVSDQRRSSFVSTSSSSLGAYVSKTTSKAELSKQSSVPTTTHVSSTPPQLHHPRLSVPVQPPVSLKTTLSTTAVQSIDPGPRMVYSHAHNPPFVGYPEQMMPIQNPVLTQPPFALTQNRFPGSQVPTAAMMPFQHPLASQQQQPDVMQRAMQNPFLLQHSVSTPHNTPTQPNITTQSRIKDNQQSVHNSPAVEKSDPQRSAPSSQNVNPPLVSSSVPGMPQLPPQYLHPAQAGMQQKPVYPPHLYFPGPTVPPFSSLPPYMAPFLGVRPAMTSLPIVRTVAEDASRQSQKPLQTPPPPRAMPPHPYHPRREQPSHIPINRPNYAINPQVPVHPAFPAQHAPPESRHPGPTQIHQPQYVKHDGSQYPPQRTEHGERFVRADSEQSQMEMVEQHFALSGIAASQPPTHPHQPQTMPQDNKGYPPTQEAPTSTAMQHQSTSAHGNNMYPQMVPRHVLEMSHGMLRHGEKYTPPIPGGVMPWPYSGGNFRPPLIPSQQTQLQHSPQMLTAQPPETYQGQARANPSPTTEAPDQVMDLFEKYPVIWQGLLALKNDSAAVQTHYICGDRHLAQACLPQPAAHVETDKDRNLAVLRIVQRMRLEPQQLEGIDNRIMENSDYCLLLALPCGRDQTDLDQQQCALKRSFIDYLKQKQAAGIVNVQHQAMQSNLQYVLHVFPPCEFTTKHLQCQARDLLSNINDIQHIMIVIAAV